MKADYIGYALAIIGLILSYYFYRKSIRIKEPVYAIKSNNLISGSKSNYEYLKVLYKNKKVENFTVSRFLFYNRGAETITKQDIETINRLRIIGKDEVEILDAKILQVNNPSNNFDLFLDKKPFIELKKKNYLIDFEYIDKNHGVVFEVIHTGLSSDDLYITGDIKGVQKILELPVQFMSASPTGKRIAILAGITFVPLLLVFSMAIFLAGIYFFDTSRIPEPEALSNKISIVLIMIFIVFGIIIQYYSLSKRLRGILPNGLEKFLD